MKKNIKLEELDCANCAAKIENAIGKLDNVTDVKVNFMSQKMILEAPDDKFDDVLAEVKKTVKKIEPDVVILS
ncbi:cation transporter [Paenibacillus lutimineralis]|uniref:Heavy metal transporter n=1 Tax=Paenibacillus lutimineralis TaxID=2707005 RepID=A0A3S9UV08_9BACL|nr:cation transporter [Paenibacillus lutimineralis]AZS14189.1 heavy metal transporter [Paenibacillus lutimineralis]